MWKHHQESKPSPGLQEHPWDLDHSEPTHCPSHCPSRNKISGLLLRQQPPVADLSHHEVLRLFSMKILIAVIITDNEEIANK